MKNLFLIMERWCRAIVVLPTTTSSSISTTASVATATSGSTATTICTAPTRSNCVLSRWFWSLGFRRWFNLVNLEHRLDRICCICNFLFRYNFFIDSHLRFGLLFLDSQQTLQVGGQFLGLDSGPWQCRSWRTIWTKLGCLSLSGCN